MYMQIRLPLACLFILLYSFLQYKRKERLQTVSSRIFELLMVGSFIHVTSAVVTEYTVNNRSRVPEAFNYFWHIVFLISLSFTCMMVYSYLICYIERAIGRIARAQRLIVSSVCTFFTIGEIILPIEYIDTPNGSYSLGMKAYCLYAIVVILMVMMLYNVIRYRKFIEKRLCRSMIWSVGIFVVIALIQMRFPYMLLTDVAITMIAVGLMMGSEDPHLFIDYGTGLCSEAGCKELVKELVLKRKSFDIGVCVFYGDIDSVKSGMAQLKADVGRLSHYLICGTPINNVIIIMPSVFFSDNSKKRIKDQIVPEYFGDAKCVSEVLSFTADTTIDEVVRRVDDFKTLCDETEHQTDELTGLLRRTAYFKRAQRIIDERSPFAFIMIDIDNFKDINDSYGHSIGDEVLEYAADTFRSSICSQDLACRMGGDEFSVILRDVTDNERITAIVNRFYKNLAHTNLSDGRKLHVTMSIGIKVYLPDNGIDSFDELYLASDEALYKAKNAGKNRFYITS